MDTVALFVSVGVGTAFSATGDFMGAQEVLQRIGKAAAVPGESKPSADAEEGAKLARDLREFKAVRTTLPVEEAAGRWLALYDRFWMLPPSVLTKTIGYFPLQAKGGDSLSAEFLMSAVPPPAGWDALKRLVLARPSGGRGPSETLLRLTVSYLTGDQAGVTAGIAEMKSAATLSKRDAGFLDRLVRNSPALAAGAAAESCGRRGPREGHRRPVRALPGVA